MGRTSDARERLIESGSELMHQRGYTAVGVSGLCEAAGVKKGSFYHFFPSKVELAAAVIDRLSVGSEAAMDQLTNGKGPPLERLAAYADGVFETQSELHESCGQVLGCPIGNLGLEMSTQEPALRERLDRVFDRNVETFESVLREAVKGNDVAPLDITGAAYSILALVEGSVMLAKMKNDPGFLRGLKRDLFRLIGAELEVEN
ncbi:MAG: TetR/AcrR family transcriptional regulator [bacterium]|nr:TetR/AcrR family transcriptional regulator [bacterium]